MKKFLTWLLAATLMLLGVVMIAPAASATYNHGDEGCTTEYSGWVRESPGEGWVKIDTRTVTDEEAYDEDGTTVRTFYVLRGWDKDYAPSTSSPGWLANPGAHNGHPDPGPNTPYTTGADDPENPKSRNWFYYSEEIIPGEHHDAVTHEEYKYKKVTCPPDEEPFTPYEVDACWTMSHTDGIEGTYEWPQTYGCVPPACDETVEYQHDKYWIRDKEDEATLASIKANGMTSPASDASLEPHGYYSEVVHGDECTETVEFPVPSVNDPCGPRNATWIKPDDTDRVHWIITEDGRLIGETQGKYRWPNGERINSWGTATDSGTECPVPPTPVVYAAPASAPPTCDTAGSFDLPERSGLLDWSITPEYTGPGTYTVTATLVGNTVWSDGFASRSRSVEITVDGATGFQSSDPEADCYVAPPEDCENSPSPETCPEPEGTRNEDTSTECVDGDLVTTNSVEGTEAVWNEETLAWDLVSYATSSQSIKPDAKKCADKPVPPTPNPPNPNPPHHNPPAPVPVDANLAGQPLPNTGGPNLWLALLGAGLLCFGAVLIPFKRREH